MNKVKVNRRILIVTLLMICSFFIEIYQFKYSESAKIKENLKDFSNVKAFLSSKVSQIDIENIVREDNYYSFTIVNKKKIDNFQELGKVYMMDEKGDLISYFVLFKNNGEYLIYMREIYMSMD